MKTLALALEPQALAALADAVEPVRLVVDLFAGGGGASEGIRRALGRGPDIAVNHDADAIALHTVNHPETLHLNANVWAVDPDEAIAQWLAWRGLPAATPVAVDLLWASPDCKHFSKAKGGKPVEKAIRDLAWVVHRWTRSRRAKPAVVLLENVEEFRSWGPLTPEGMPCPKRRGHTFELWIREFMKRGYKVEHRELRACDYGAPTIRKRLFLVARCDGRPIVWPEPTHCGPTRAKPASPAVLRHGLKPWRSAAECIDWSIPCPSIFLTKEEGRAIGVKRPLAEATMTRIAMGLKRWVLEHPEPYIVHMNHGDSRGRRTFGLDEPLTTVEASGGKQALVTPFAVRVDQTSGAGRGLHGVHDPMQPMRTVTSAGGMAVVAPYMIPRYGERPPVRDKRGQEPRSRDVAEPMPVVVPTANGASLVAAFLAQHNLNNVGHDAREPFSTIVGKGCTQGLAAVHLMSMKGADRRSGDVRAPTPAITAQGTHLAAVCAVLVKYYGTAVGQDVREPLHTVTTDDRFAVVMVRGEPLVIYDIGMRMFTPRELYRAQGFEDGYAIDRRPDGSALTKTAQVRLCGNCVPPPFAEALARANCLPADAAQAGEAA